MSPPVGLVLGLGEVALRRGGLDAAEEDLRAATTRLAREEGWTVEPRVAALAEHLTSP